MNFTWLFAYIFCNSHITDIQHCSFGFTFLLFPSFHHWLLFRVLLLWVIPKMDPLSSLFLMRFILVIHTLPWFYLSVNDFPVFSFFNQTPITKFIPSPPGFQELPKILTSLEWHESRSEQIWKETSRERKQTWCFGRTANSSVCPKCGEKEGECNWHKTGAVIQGDII